MFYRQESGQLDPLLTVHDVVLSYNNIEANVNEVQTTFQIVFTVGFNKLNLLSEKYSKHRADLATVLLTMRQASLPILVISYFNQRRQLKSSSFWQDFDRLQDGSLQYANVDNPLYRICLEPAAQPGEVNRYIVYTVQSSLQDLSGASCTAR